MALSMKALSSAVKAVRVSFSSRRSEMRRLSKCVLQPAVALVVHDAVGHGRGSFTGAEPGLCEAAPKRQKLGKRPGAS